jgi:hypothetical protein
MLPGVRAVIDFVCRRVEIICCPVGSVPCGVRLIERAVRDLLTNRTGALAP